MWLLTLKTRHMTEVIAYEDQDEAIITGRDHVGQHSSVDGCSTPPREYENIKSRVWTSYRSTSFGERTARVEPLVVVAKKS